MKDLPFSAWGSVSILDAAKQTSFALKILWRICCQDLNYGIEKSHNCKNILNDINVMVLLKSQKRHTAKDIVREALVFINDAGSQYLIQ